MQAMRVASGVRALPQRVAPVRAARPSARRAVTVQASNAYPSDWLKSDPLVFVLGAAGWTVPSNIPVAAFGGKSLFGLLMGSIGTELAHWPTGPALDSPFWLYMITWHVGLFLTLFLGQIGVQSRKQGYY